MASHLLPPGCDDILPDGVHALTSASSKEIAKIKNHDGLNPKSLLKVLKDLSKTLVADKTKSEAAAASGHVPLKLVHPKMKAEAPKDLDKKSDPPIRLQVSGAMIVIPLLEMAKALWVEAVSRKN